MPLYKVKVKWGKEFYTDIELNTEEEPLLFKAQLFALTGVQPERQKIMLKGATIKDNSWDNIKLKEGATLLLMGSKEEDVVQEPKEKTLFHEDLSENELASVMEMPAGLTNLGNTCYMNATIQCLKVVPELKTALQQFEGGYGQGGVSFGSASDSMTAALRDLYMSMEKSSTVSPIILLQVLHTTLPRFAEKGEQSGYMQQDANEFWTELIRLLQQKLKIPKQTSESPIETSGCDSFIERYFGGTFCCQLKCSESDTEQVTQSSENFLQLSCFISQDVKYLHSGLMSRLSEQITKRSSVLDRDAVYIKTSRISRLPAYLIIQFVRFYFKEKESINAKILKDVKFALSLDVFDLCTSELQKNLIPMRTKFQEQEDKRMEMGKTKKEGGDGKKIAPSLENIEPYSFPEDLGSSNSGYYQLQSVLTHKGRSSSSGHYVAWVRRGPDEWIKCDDDNVCPISSEEILKLSGGGDWHCAYVLLYGPRLYVKDETITEAMDVSFQP